GAAPLRPVTAVPAGAPQIDQPHLILRQAEKAREGFVVAMGALRGRPHRRLFLVDVGDSAGRPDRTVALHRPEITGAAAECAVAIAGWLATTHQHLVGEVEFRAQGGDELVLGGKSGPLAPLRAKRARGAYGRPLVVSNNREEVLDAHHARARKIFDR